MAWRSETAFARSGARKRRRRRETPLQQDEQKNARQNQPQYPHDEPLPIQGANIGSERQYRRLARFFNGA